MSAEWQEKVEEARNNAVRPAVEQARNALQQAREASKNNRSLDAVSFYAAALELFRGATQAYGIVISYASLSDSGRDVSKWNKELTALDRELRSVLKEFQVLVARLLTPEIAPEQGLEIIRKFWSEDERPSYLHWKPKEKGGKTCFDLVCRYFELHKEWKSLLELLEEEVAWTQTQEERHLREQLLVRIEHVSSKIDDSELARSAKSFLKYQRALDEKHAANYEEARKIFAQLMGELEPDNFSARSVISRQMAECEVQLGKFEEASKSLQAGYNELDRIPEDRNRMLAQAVYNVHSRDAQKDVQAAHEQAELNLFGEYRKKYLVAHSENEYREKLNTLNRALSFPDKKMALEKINVVEGCGVEVNGFSFTFTTDHNVAVLVGDYVLIVKDDKEKLLAQVEDFEDRDDSRIYSGAVLRELSGDPRLAPVVKEDRCDPNFFSGGQIEIASPWVLTQYVSQLDPESVEKDGAAALFVGSLSQVRTDPPIKVVLDHRGFGQHTCLFGQSGSGKSFAIGRLLEELLLHTAFRIVVLDPNSDYRNSSHIEKTDTVLRHWRMASRSADLDFDAEARRDYESYDKWLTDHSHQIWTFAHAKSATGGVRAIELWFSDIDVNYQSRLLHLDPQFHADDLQAYRDLLEAIKGPQYDIDQVEKLALTRVVSEPRMQRLLQRLRNSNLASLAIWKSGDRRRAKDQLASLIDELKSSTWRLFELDIGELKPIEKRLVSSTVLDALWQQRESCVKRPMLLVIDEAHHLVSRDPDSQEAKAATEIINEIAGEGRKYGIFLIVISQSPSKLHPFTLSQCSNLILMKTRYESDLAVVRDAFSQVPKKMIDQAKNFQSGEAFVIGEKLVRSPLRFRFAPRRSKEGQEKVDLSPGAVL